MNKLLIATVAFAAMSGAAAAQAPGGDHGPGAMFAAADANHDGNITRAEFDAARGGHFTQMDANHDGSLSADERPQHGPPPGAAPGGGDHAAHGPRGDTNGDGVISRAEFDAQGADMFARLDADHNGAISQAEIQAMRDAHGGQH
jgi:EF hand